MPAAQDVWWEARKCIGCLACVEACPTDARVPTADGMDRDTEQCAVCGACVKACPSEATTFTGRECALDTLAKEVLKDQDYYEAFGGGVSVSRRGTSEPI